MERTTPIQAQPAPGQTPLAPPAKGTTELDLAYQVVKELFASQWDLERVLNAVVEQLSQWSGMDRAMITILDSEGREARVEASSGLSAAEQKRGRYRSGEGIIGRVLHDGQPALLPSIDQDPEFLDRTATRKHLDRSKIAFLCVPIRFRDAVVGTLSVDRPTSGDADLSEELRVLEVIAAMIGTAVQHQREHREELESLKRENARLGGLQAQRARPRHVVGESREMRNVFGLVGQVAPTDTTVLIRGESGTGKELVARAIHDASGRKERAFVAVNCGSLPSQLVESELFGHVRGAFTGAGNTRRGRFEMADGGTIFLDEVGELELASQVKLLRVLQERQIFRLGDEHARDVDVRVVAATNANLEEAMTAGTFREDLYYRLNVFPVFLPPLRERKGDIIALADHFLEQAAAAHGRKVVRLSAPAIDLMMAYHWPGNVRELENCMARAVLLCEDGVVRAHHLPPSLQTGASTSTTEPGSLDERMMAFERELLIEAMRNAGGNQAQAARDLATTPRILGYRLRRQGLLEELAKPRRGRK